MATDNRTTDLLRPKWITWVCVAFYTAGLINIILSFTGIYAEYGLFYSAINLLLIVVLFAALSGIWSMEKWGVILFAAILLVKMGVDIYSKAFRFWELALFIPAIFLLFQYKKMK